MVSFPGVPSACADMGEANLLAYDGCEGIFLYKVMPIGS
jgi:hypothetical protein